MKKQEYIKPTIEVIEMNCESIMQTDSLGTNSDVTLGNDLSVGTKRNFADFDIWGEDEVAEE